MELVVVRRMLGKCKVFVRSIQRYSIELKAVGFVRRIRGIR